MRVSRIAVYHILSGIYFSCKNVLSSYIAGMPSIQDRKWADVVLPHPPYGRFTYLIPERFREDICVGHRVRIPLGRRWMTGIVVEFIKKTDIPKLREIADILDPYPLLGLPLLKLTSWIAEYYLAIAFSSRITFKSCNNIS